MTMAGSSNDPERSKTVTGPFGPDRPPTQTFRAKNGCFLVYSTIADIRANFTISGSKRADGPETVRFH